MDKYEKLEVEFTIVATVLVLAAILVPGIIKVMNPREVTTTVTDKWVKNNGDSGKYLISTDEGVYEVTDSLWKMRFDSSDVYAGIEVGETYTFEIAGVRSPFFSLYPNIYEVQVTE